MSTILIKADKQSNKLLTDLAKKLDGDVIDMKDDQLEDFLLGMKTVLQVTLKHKLN